MTIRERVREIDEAKRKALEYNGKAERLSRPLLTDTSSIHDIYEYVSGRVSGVKDVRRLFLFVVLAIYSPSSLCGTRMRHGLRFRIAKTIGCSITVVSHSISDVLFTYDHYKGFRSDADALLRGVLGMLSGKGRLSEEQIVKYVKI